MSKIVAVLAVLFVAGCSRIEGYQMRAIITECGGADKVYAMWRDVYTIKAECTDGRHAGEWGK